MRRAALGAGDVARERRDREQAFDVRARELQAERRALLERRADISSTMEERGMSIPRAPPDAATRQDRLEKLLGRLTVRASTSLS